MENRISTQLPAGAGAAAIERYPVETPRYDWKGLSPAVVHFGVGGFHRAHQAVYFDELAALGHTEWGVIGVGISKPQLREVLERQDNLFVVVERSPSGSSARVVASMVEYLLLAEERDSVLRRLVDPKTRLVTMTITGDGYRIGESGDGNAVFSVVVEALADRRRTGAAPFTVLSCDNLPDSGAAAREATLVLAGRHDPALAGWIEANVQFPSSMVDRITPSITPEEQASVVEEFNVRDGWPVVTEPFTQWVIEDRFTAGRPPLDQVGARFVHDVRPYKLIKSRLLNGTHSVLGYLGCLAGYERTDEALADTVIAECISRLMRQEVAPLLPGDVPGMELGEYVDAVLERLCNPAIADPLSRLCGRGSTKMVDYVLPSLHEAREAGSEHPMLTLAVAAWCRYLQGEDLQGQPLEINDARLEQLQPLAREAGGAVVPLLDVADIFGDLGHDPAFVAEVRRSISLLDSDGVQGAISTLLAES
jgi:mannitol 2-dehydrogenase